MAGERLLAMIRGSDLVERLKKLAEAIASDDGMISRYGALLALQKRLVAAAFDGRSELAARLRAQYDAALEDLADAPAVAEYLSLVDELDDALQEVAGILNDGIKRI